MAPPSQQPRPGEGVSYNLGNDDFVGLRPYHPGDSPRHIAWKAATRSINLLTKQFSGRADVELWLDWDELPPSMNIEAKLSRLARWVIDAHANGHRFGLHLPHKTFSPDSGMLHREHCLEALALFDSKELRSATRYASRPIAA